MTSSQTSYTVQFGGKMNVITLKRMTCISNRIKNPARPSQSKSNQYHFDIEDAAQQFKLWQLKFSRLTILITHRNVKLLLSQE
jgi:hypothetical protein